MTGACLTFDVGGTTSRAGVVDLATAELVDHATAPTPSRETHPDAGYDELEDLVFEHMEALGRRVLDGERPDAVVVAFPGPVDPSGRVASACTVWADNGPVDVGDRVRRSWPSAPVTVINDVTAAGYHYVGLGRSDFCILTVSSGIGHKVFAGSRPLLGPAYRGGEIGHLLVDDRPDALLCDCGGRGHLGAVASGRGVLRTAMAAAADAPSEFAASLLGRRTGGDAGAITNELIVEGFAAGDEWTTAIVSAAARRVGAAMAAIHLSVGVEEFVLMGGFAIALGERYRRLVCESLGSHAWSVAGDWDGAVEVAEPGDTMALHGAGVFASLTLGGAE